MKALSLILSTTKLNHPTHQPNKITGRRNMISFPSSKLRHLGDMEEPEKDLQIELCLLASSKANEDQGAKFY
ncbi:hypothetical protein STEG23_025601 [Scotinomys teguina]